MSKFSQVCPLMTVSNLDQAVEFYVQTLGFECLFKYGEPPMYSIVTRDGQDVHLSTGEPSRVGHGTMYSYVSGVDALYQKVTDGGARVIHPLKDQDYGMRDFYLADPDGNLLGFGENIE